MKTNKSLNQIRPVGNKVILPALNHRSVFELPAAKVDPIFKMPGESGKTSPRFAEKRFSKPVDRKVYELPTEMKNSKKPNGQESESLLIKPYQSDQSSILAK